jgi:hypothetical protein
MVRLYTALEGRQKSSLLHYIILINLLQVQSTYILLIDKFLAMNHQGNYNKIPPFFRIPNEFSLVHTFATCFINIPFN